VAAGAAAISTSLVGLDVQDSKTDPTLFLSPSHERIT